MRDRRQLRSLFFVGGTRHPCVTRSTHGRHKLDSYTYSYDRNGNPTSIADSQSIANGGEGTRSFGYDAFDRLTSASSSAAPWSTAVYDYDEYDNLKTKTLAGDQQTFAYDSSQRLDEIRQGTSTTADLVSFGYDARGRITSYTASSAGLTAGYSDKSFVYDSADRLLELTRMGDEPWFSVTDHYTYDAFGRRVTSRWFPPGQQPFVQEDVVYNSAGLLLYNDGRKRYEECANTTDLQPFTTRYLYLGRSLIASTEQGVCKTGVIRYHHTDALGSVVARTDPAKAITDRNRFEPYGKQTDLIPASVEPAFTGHNQDMSGLVYMQARYYDSAIGRFLATDPLGVANGNGGAFNRYAYASNNPMANIDPDGMQDFGVLGNLCAFPGSCTGGAPYDFNAESLATVGKIGGTVAALSLGAGSVAITARILWGIGSRFFGAVAIGDMTGASVAVAEATTVAVEVAAPPGLVLTGLPQAAEMLYGPFHRRGDPPEVIEAIRASGELWGRASRNYMPSLSPKAKGYGGRLRAGDQGFSFMTNVPPDAGGHPRQPTWTPPRYGVEDRGEFAVIKCIMITTDC